MQCARTQAAVRETLAHLERVGSSRDLTAGVDTDKLAEPMTSFGQVRRGLRLPGRDGCVRKEGCAAPRVCG